MSKLGVKPTQIINVELGNRVAKLSSCPDGLEPEVAALLRPYFAYRALGFQFSRFYKSGIWDGYTCLLKGGKIPSGLFLQQKAEVQKEHPHISFQVQDLRDKPKFRDWLPGETRKFGDRQFQRDCVDAMVTACYGGVVLNATGSGKTFMAGMFLGRLQGSACFVVDELTLLDQAMQEISQVTGEPVGIVGKGLFQPQRLTVASVQTLFRHRQRKDFQKWFKLVDVILLDEFHVAMNRSNISVVANAKPKAVFGLTATLELGKRPTLFQALSLAGPVIFEYGHSQGVEEGVLAKGGVCQVTYKQNGQGTGYDSEYKYMIVLRKGRNDLIEALVREGVARGHKVVILVERLKHLQLLSKRLQGIPHRTICGAVDVESRIQAKQDMEGGSLNLIIANRVFGKGVNIKAVDMIVDGTAAKSGNNARQRYGRGSRILEGKPGLLYFDIGDATKKRKNRFALAARRRRKALENSGIPVMVRPAKVGAPKLIQEMEERL